MASLEDELEAISNLDIDTMISRAMALIETKISTSTYDKYTTTLEREEVKKVKKRSPSVIMQDDPSIYSSEDAQDKEIDSLQSSKRGVSRKTSLKPRTGPRRYSSLSDVSSTDIYRSGKVVGDEDSYSKKTSPTISPIDSGPSTRTKTTKVTKNGKRTVTRTRRSVTSDNVGGGRKETRTKTTTISASRSKNPHPITPTRTKSGRMSFVNSPPLNPRSATKDGVNDRSLNLEPHIHVDEDDDDDGGDRIDNYYTTSSSYDSQNYMVRLQSGESFDDGYPSHYGGHGKEIVSRRSAEYNPHDLSPIRLKSNKKSVKKKR